MSYARQVFSNTVVQIAAKVIIALLSVVTIKMITNYLGQTQYGEYTYIYEYLGLFAILADMGLYTIGVKEMSSGKQTLAKVLSNILGMRIFLATGSMLLALLYAYVFG
ncbi:MAG: oligosaccharide flippase family protein [Patescibacteria group bacterium]|nr:oligosaccharide flippase family protein [Patescibacteria group bacterium]